MPDLSEQLDQCFQGRVCLMGLGNVDYGDDGLGVRLAETLVAEGLPDVIVAGTTPERFIGRVADAGYDHVIFLDAVEFGGAPGSVVFLDSEEMAARFPQVSTHKISLGVLAKWAEDKGTAKAWLLGVQPESLKPSTNFTPAVRTTLDMLVDLLLSMKPKALDCCENRSFSWIEHTIQSDLKAVVPTAIQSLRLQHSCASVGACAGGVQ